MSFLFFRPHVALGLVLFSLAMMLSPGANSSYAFSPLPHDVPEGAAEAPVASDDLSFSRNIDLQIEQVDGSYEIGGSIVERIRLKSERSVSLPTWTVADPFYATVSNVQVFISGDRLDGDRIQQVVEDRGDVFISGVASYRIDLPGDMPAGTAIKVRYNIAYDSPAYLPLLELPRLPGEASVEATLEHPAELHVRSASARPESGVRVSTTRPDPTKTLITIQAPESRSPRPLEMLPSHRAAVRLTLSDERGDITPSTSQDFADWYASKLPSGGLVPDSVAHELVDGAESRRDTIRALYDFVRRDVRYVSTLEGEGAIIPRHPASVYDTRYGDCKDKSFFVQQTARQLGLQVDLVLLSVSPSPRFEAPHVRMFDHVINAAAVDGDTLYFDATYRDVPFGSIPYADASRRALLLGDDARWVTLPRPRTADLSIELDASMENRERGSAMVHVTGPLYNQAVQALDERSAVKRENALSGIVGPWLYRIGVKNFVLVERTDETISFQADADLSSFVIESSTRAYFPQTALRVAPAKVTERMEDSDPLRVPVGPGVDLTLRIRAPGMTAVSDSLVAGIGSGPRFRAHVEPTADGDSSAAMQEPIVLSYQYRPGPRYLDGADRSAFLDYTRTLLAAKREMFILSHASD